jgi:hypothetical protein
MHLDPRIASTAVEVLAYEGDHCCVRIMYQGCATPTFRLDAIRGGYMSHSTHLPATPGGIAQQQVWFRCTVEAWPFAVQYGGKDL